MDDNWGYPNFSGNLHIYDINGGKHQYDRIINNTLGEKRGTPFSDKPTYFQINRISNVEKNVPSEQKILFMVNDCGTHHLNGLMKVHSYHNCELFPIQPDPRSGYHLATNHHLLAFERYLMW